MTTVGKSIVVLGGEPSSASTTINDLGILYVLDTTKIRYPNDAQQAAAQRGPQTARRPSTTEGSNASRQLPSREGSNGPSDSRKLIGVPSSVGNLTNGHRRSPNGSDVTNMASNVVPGSPPGAPLGAAASKLPRAAPPASSPIGPPPQGPTPSKPVVDTASMGRIRGASTDRVVDSASPQHVAVQSPVAREVIHEIETAPATVPSTIPTVNGRKTPTQLARSASKQDQMGGDVAKSKIRTGNTQGSVDSATEPALKTVMVRPSSPPPPTRQPSNPLSRRSSGRNSQTVALLKELDSARNRNAWYASELELARKSGYVPNTNLVPALDSKSVETFDDEDRPLIEALLAMRTELANVQSAVDKQAVVASRQIAEADKQRDAAIQEAVYAKAKLAAHMGGSASSTPQLGSERDEPESRSNEMGKKLASALHVQKNLHTQLELMRSELEAEKRARALADDTTKAAQKRMADLEVYRQNTSTDVERLKAELHLVQREAREQSVASAAAVASLELIIVERDDLSSKYQEALGDSKDRNESFDSLRTAIAASEDARTHIEIKLEEERAQREKAESTLSKLKVEHEARTAELVAVTQRLRDVEELAEKHANEARTHRQAVISGLDKMAAKEEPKVNKADADRILVLQSQVTAANALVKKYQQEADTAADKLRSAEERIAGLEQYQEQSSREGVTIRRQLQSALRDAQGHQAAKADLLNQLAAQQLETNAMNVQHNALKDILGERNISPTSAVRARGLNSSRTNSPEQFRVRELEAQLASATTAHEETKMIFASQTQDSETAYREKLSQLESDYQSAVHYVKGTEKMLKQMKEQLSRYKTDNGRLKNELIDLEDQLQAESQKSGSSPSWEAERGALQDRISSLEGELRASTSQLERHLETLKLDLADAKRQRSEALKGSEETTRSLGALRKDYDHLHSENLLLEQRATDAEQKVSLLLDQVEHSVDNYRRRSRQVPSMGSEGTIGGTNGLGLSHSRQESSENESEFDANGLDARNSAALDNLASELETLRSHWETTNKNYRLSTNFDFEPTTMSKKDDDDTVTAGMGLSESLADWRKKLDTEENHTIADKTK